MGYLEIKCSEIPATTQKWISIPIVAILGAIALYFVYFINCRKSINREIILTNKRVIIFEPKNIKSINLTDINNIQYNDSKMVISTTLCEQYWLNQCDAKTFLENFTKLFKYEHLKRFTIEELEKNYLFPNADRNNNNKASKTFYIQLTIWIVMLFIMTAITN